MSEPSEQSSPRIEACKRDLMKLILSVFAFAYLVLVTLIYGYCVVRGMDIKGEAAGALCLLAGLAISIVKDSFGFVFGSSQGSQDKTAALVSAGPVVTAPLAVQP